MPPDEPPFISRCPHGRRFYDECHPCHLCPDCEADLDALSIREEWWQRRA